MVRSCKDSHGKRPGNRQMKRVQGSDRQILEIFQQGARGQSMRIGERLYMKVASPDVTFKRRPGVAHVLDGDITSAPAARQQTTQLDCGEPADYSAVLSTYE